MTLPTATDPPKPPAWRPLDTLQRRVLGVLIEKAKTTPAGYPMSVNAIVIGCNQKSNREPPMTLTSDDVEETLRHLERAGVVSEVDWLGRVPKYRHHAYDWFGVSKPEIAVLTELLLRGEQTLGDLRARAARMEPIADQAALKPIVEGLIARRLMVELTPPGRGQILTHNVYPERELADLRARYKGHVPRPSADDGASDRSAAALGSGGPAAASAFTAGSSDANDARPREIVGADSDRMAAMTSELAELRAEVARLREQVDDLTRRVESRG